MTLTSATLSAALVPPLVLATAGWVPATGLAGAGSLVTRATAGALGDPIDSLCGGDARNHTAATTDASAAAAAAAYLGSSRTPPELHSDRSGRRDFRARFRFDLAISRLLPCVGPAFSPFPTPVSRLELQCGRAGAQIGSNHQRLVVAGLGRRPGPENRVNVTFLVLLDRRGEERVRGCHGEFALACGRGCGSIGRRTSRAIVSRRHVHGLERQGCGFGLE